MSEKHSKKEKKTTQIHENFDSHIIAYQTMCLIMYVNVTTDESR